VGMSAAIYEGRRRIPIIIPAEGRVRRVYTADVEILYKRISIVVSPKSAQSSYLALTVLVQG
jgi:hypothetical protein